METEVETQLPPENAAPAFPCSLCDKRFNNKKSQIRHVSYCRKSRASGPKSRKKACLQCTKAKTQCEVSVTSFGVPQCSHCRIKQLDCKFKQAPVVDAAKSPPRPRTLKNMVATVENPHSSASKTSHASAELSILACDIDQLWSNEIASTDLPELVEHAVDAVSSLGRPNASTTHSATHTWADSLNTADYEIIVSDTFSFQPASPQLLLSSEARYPSYSNIGSFPSTLNQIVPRPPKAFWPKKDRNNFMSLNKKYVICTIKTYPRMLSEGNLPPFINACLSKRENAKSSHLSLPGPLSICLGIVQMFSVMNKNNSAFIWKTIRMEQERLAAECSQYEDEDAVAGLQAVAIYMLLRISEDNEDVTDFDLPLIQTMIKLAMRLDGVTAKYSSPFKDGKLAWKNFILVESLRRTIIVISLIELLFDISAGLFPHQCDGTKFAKMTLPCARNIWSAISESEWERACDRQPDGLGVANCLTYGDILSFHLGFEDPGKLLDNWLMEMDELGTLVMAAAGCC